MVGLAAVSFVGIFFFEMPFPMIIFAVALIGFVGARLGRPEFGALEHVVRFRRGRQPARRGIPAHVRPNTARTLQVIASGSPFGSSPSSRFSSRWAGNVFSQIAVFFSKMAMVTFGGAYAVLAYVAQQAVENYGWVTPGRCSTALEWRRRRPGP